MSVYSLTLLVTYSLPLDPPLPNFLFPLYNNQTILLTFEYTARIAIASVPQLYTVIVLPYLSASENSRGKKRVFEIDTNTEG